MTRPKFITWPRFVVAFLAVLVVFNVAEGDAFAAAVMAFVAGLYLDDALTGAP